MELQIESLTFSEKDIPSFLKKNIEEFSRSTNSSPESKKQPSKFKKFINIITSAYPKSANVISNIQNQKAKSAEQIEIEKEAFILLQGNDFVNFSKLLKYGYEMPDKQKKMFSEKMTALIGSGRYSSDYKTDIINPIIGAGAILPLETIQSIFFKTNFDIFCLDYLLLLEKENNSNNGKTPIKLNIRHFEKTTADSLQSHASKNRDHVVKAIGEFASSLENKRLLFDNWKGLVKTYLYTSSKDQSIYSMSFSSILRFFDYFNQVVIPYSSPEELNETFNLLSNLKKHYIKEQNIPNKEKDFHYESDLGNIDTFINSLNVVPTEFSNDKIKNLIEKTKSVYMQKRLQSITLERQTDMFEKINTKYLPNDTKLMVENIENIFEKINTEKLSLEQDTVLEMERLMFEKTPKLLQQYLSLDDEFKTTMKNHNQQTPKDLLDVALGDILSIFNQLNEQLNYNKMTDLSVSQKHVKNLKASF